MTTKETIHKLFAELLDDAARAMAVYYDKTQPVGRTGRTRPVTRMTHATRHATKVQAVMAVVTMARHFGYYGITTTTADGAVYRRAIELGLMKHEGVTPVDELPVIELKVKD